MRLDVLLLPVHPHHKLKAEYTEIPFRCDGCKELGIGLKYNCRDCDFDLHMECALAVPTKRHRLYKECEFQFHVKPLGGVKRFCDACGEDVRGFVYHCKVCGFYLHPCCAKLPYKVNLGDRVFYLSKKLSAPCEQCGTKGPGCSYRSEGKSYNLHVSCVKELLVDKWLARLRELARSPNADSKKTRKIASLRSAMKEQLMNKRKVGKAHKYCRNAFKILKVVVSAVFGDPTAMIAVAVQGFIAMN